MKPVKYVKNFFGAIYATDLENFNFVEDIGLNWIRKGATWKNFEPEKGKYNFEQYDQLVKKCKRKNISIMPTLNTIPAWGSKGSPDSNHRLTHYPPEDELIDYYRDYVRKVLKRYPDIKYFELWNEPNVKHFLKTVNKDEEVYQAYVDKILIPAASVIKEMGKKVIGPSFALEWPEPTRGPSYCFNVKSNIEALDTWLNYHQAWQYIDILSVHYVKGDSQKHEMLYAEDLMPLFDHLDNQWLKPGKLDGIWNTEAGLTALEVSDDYGFVSLEPWEKPPYGQWVPRYTIPLIHWGLEHKWDNSNKYKIFWFKLKTDSGALEPTNLLIKIQNYDKDKLSATGKAMKTLIKTITSGNMIDTYQDDVKVGLGLHSPGLNYQFKNYSFQLDNNIFIAAWLNLPGIEFIPSDNSNIEATVSGIPVNTDLSIYMINYLNGNKIKINEYSWNCNKKLEIKIPRIPDPVLYLKVERK